MAATIGIEQAQAGIAPVITEQLVHIDLRDERVQGVVSQVQAAISSVYASAEFTSYIGTNPLGVYVEVYTDGNDFDGILQVLSKKVNDLHVAAGVNVCVVPRQRVSAVAA